MRLSCLPGLDVTVKFKVLFEAKASVDSTLPFDLVLVLVIAPEHSLFFSELMIFPIFDQGQLVIGPFVKYIDREYCDLMHIYIYIYLSFWQL